MISILSTGPLDQCVHWLVDRLVAAKKKPAEYPAAVLANYGPRAMFEPPPIILGTIHSVIGVSLEVYTISDLEQKRDALRALEAAVLRKRQPERLSA